MLPYLSPLYKSTEPRSAHAKPPWRTCHQGGFKLLFKCTLFHFHIKTAFYPFAKVKIGVKVEANFAPSLQIKLAKNTN